MASRPEALPPAIALLGPTASGKSALAMAIAARHAVEIISVDSAQVFRGMDVGTAKPSVSERAAVPHHLIDIIDPTEAYSAARFRADTLRLMQEIVARGRTPLLAGGTMLYFKSLREGLSDLPAADPALRAALELEATRHGWPRMHARLAQLDPVTAARLQPTDAQRIQRALEVQHLTGKTLSSLQQRSGEALELPVHLIGIALVPSDRAVLHQRIAARFDAMLATGLVEELKALKKTHNLRADMAAMRCVGYRQAWEYLAGDYDRATLRDKGVFATRQLAKRQLTWLRAMPELQVFDCLAPDLQQQVFDHLRHVSAL
ncbi:MAG: tRNA (adenosine(37)-N6)-dimethylallyltransferase MiaA [Proteobacteria bacterium]|nr:tRNA (adenosine(37)-N6)-dimethylallyltransferase MiaA [Pseudomonadota bacterium]